MILMSRYPDKYFDLAVVDPPFGIGMNWNKDRRSQFYGHKNNFNKETPTADYFKELFRVSKDQIIWGCNYYWNYLEPTNNIIFWDKGKDTLTQFGSAGELAWTSIKRYPLIKADFLWNGCAVCEKTDKIHPHQKPIGLYKWQLKYFAKPGNKILDTHLGSGSSRIAAHSMGFDFTACELDKDYFEAQEKRFAKYMGLDGMFNEEHFEHG